MLIRRRQRRYVRWGWRRSPCSHRCKHGNPLDSTSWKSTPYRHPRTSTTHQPCTKARRPAWLRRGITRLRMCVYFIQIRLLRLILSDFRVLDYLLGVGNGSDGGLALATANGDEVFNRWLDLIYWFHTFMSSNTTSRAQYTLNRSTRRRSTFENGCKFSKMVAFRRLYSSTASARVRDCFWRVSENWILLDPKGQRILVLCR